MALRDILSDAINLAKTPISDRQFMIDYNNAIHDLAMTYDTAKVKTPQTIVCSDTDTEYSLTSGCFKIERVLTSDGCYFSNYEVRGNSKILFSLAGTYTIYGTFDHPDVTTMAGTITINAAYLRAIAEYIAAQALIETSPVYTTLAGKTVEVSNPRSYQTFMAQYSNDAAQANKNIRKANNPNRRVHVPRFR